MFLVGGPAYSGTTLLAFLLDQPPLVCLDEPDVHEPAQAHRGTPLLGERFPDRTFPPPTERKLSIEEAMGVLEECQAALGALRLGTKTCNWLFVDYAKAYRARGLPVIAIIRDVRDALVRPLPAWVTEEGLSDRYRLIWENRRLYDLLVRYEDLVRDPGSVMALISKVLGVALELRGSWAPGAVHPVFLKNDHHDLLRTGGISGSRVGIHRQAGREVPDHAEKTARLMGY